MLYKYYLKIVIASVPKFKGLLTVEKQVLLLVFQEGISALWGSRPADYLTLHFKKFQLSNTNEQGQLFIQLPAC